MLGAVRRKLGEDAVDLDLLARVQLAQFVIGLHRAHRLYKQRHSGGGDIVHKPRNRALVIRLDGDDVAVGAHGDYRLLKRFRVRRR